jgi:membrane-associated phospholipid phosphatase
MKSAMSDAWKWTFGLVATTAVVVVSYVWLDQPIALRAHAELSRFDIFAHLTRIPEFFPPLAIVAFAALGLRGLSGRPLSRWQTIALVTGVSFATAEMVKNQLKYAFGRTWPETWVNNNPSFIHDGAFGFNPFHGGAGFASFPSGHTTAICAVVSVLWICYPRYRVLYAALVVAVGVGLIGANFHFLSDVVAGAFLGTSAGWLAVALWELGAHPIRPRDKIPADKLKARSADLVQ